MEAFFKIFKSISKNKNQNPYRLLFHDPQIDIPLDDYIKIVQKITTQSKIENQNNYAKYLQRKCQKQQLLPIILLRFYFVLHLTFNTKGNVPISRSNISSIKIKKTSKFPAQQKFILFYKEYVQKLLVIQTDQKIPNLTLDIIKCSQIVKLLELVMKMEFLIEISFKKNYNPLFKWVRKLIFQNVRTAMEQLQKFIQDHSHLILKGHQQAQSINQIYEKAIFYNKEAERLRKTKYQNIQIPRIIFNNQINKRIQKKMNEYGIQKKNHTLRQKQDLGYIHFSLEDQPLI